jgi:hypothetical protein
MAEVLPAPRKPVMTVAGIFPGFFKESGMTCLC